MPMGEEQVLAVIMGGGRGSRLSPLTAVRSKPAVPIAGKYRLIDIPISNCINSNFYHIAVLTQFNSVSLHRHITRLPLRRASTRLGADLGCRANHRNGGLVPARPARFASSWPRSATGAKYVLIWQAITCTAWTTT
jgi:hypothetical protein